jgi:hypothetical protein
MTNASTRGMVMAESVVARFWSKVNLPDENGCTVWNAGLDSYGYGQFHVTVDGKTYNRKAHQVALELAGVEIPVGLEPDHTCEVRACVNVQHMELVTHAENLRRRALRSTHCMSGRHRWDDPGVTTYLGGKRVCRVCRNENRRMNYAAGAGRAS